MFDKLIRKVSRDEISKKDQKRIRAMLEEFGMVEDDILAAAADTNGQIIATQKGVLIGRKGSWARLGHNISGSVKFIRYRDIAAVQFKQSGLMCGFIQLTVPGGVEGKRGIVEALEDENTVTFTFNAKEFEHVRDVIREKIMEIA